VSHEATTITGMNESNQQNAIMTWTSQIPLSKMILINLKKGYHEDNGRSTGNSNRN